MGIFDVNMPLLYREGGMALFRLQEQILAASEDDSILAHISVSTEGVHGHILSLCSL